MTMTNRERYLAVLNGKSPDRVPWLPRIQLWYNARIAEGNMPERFRGMSVHEVERAIGIGDPARGGRVFKTRREGVEVRTRLDNGSIYIEYETPVGTVTESKILTTQLDGYSDSGLPMDHPIKGAADYPVWEYIVEHTYYDPCYEDYLAYDAEVGDAGFPMVGAGDVPFHHFSLMLAGYNQAFYELCDRTAQVEHLLTVMEQVDRERLWPVLADSPAILFNHGVHFDSQMTPPPMFAKYIKPYYQDFSKLLHSRGKKLSFHADDDTALLLDLVRDSGYDMAECFATAPLVSLTLAEARRVWGTDVIIYGGIPSVVLEETTPEAEFQEYVRDVFRVIAPGDAIILGIADNAMPRTIIDRVELISRMVEQHGNYPISKA